MFKQSVGANKGLLVSRYNNLTQIRTATKKVSGSKTNKNDSAGRRLGPKVHENHFVKPGQIIMRQRGTKIHPGENVKIGIDHTIYAVEPGYVCFYYDPFHPLRKYVGVSLKKELKLPTPHFSPRVRRFGYDQITNPVRAQEEEDWKSLKEIQAQGSILAQVREVEAEKEKFLKTFTGYTMQNAIEIDDIAVVSQRYYEISQYTKNGQSLEEAKAQATFNHLFNLKLASRGETAEQLNERKKNVTELFNALDTKLEVDGKGNVFAFVEDKPAKQASSLEALEKYHNRVLSTEEKKTVLDLIEEKGIFTLSEQESLKTKYLPSFISLDVPGSVVEVDVNNVPKGVVVQRVYDEVARATKVIGRPEGVV